MVTCSTSYSGEPKFDKYNIFLASNSDSRRAPAIALHFCNNQ